MLDLVGLLATTLLTLNNSVKADVAVDPEIIRAYMANAPQVESAYANSRSKIRQASFNQHGHQGAAFFVVNFQSPDGASSEVIGREVEGQFKPRSAKRLIDLRNLKYEAKIEQSKGDEWTLTELQGSRFRFGGYGYGLAACSFAPWRSPYSYSQLLSQTGTKITGTERLTWRGLPCVEIRFECTIVPLNVTQSPTVCRYGLLVLPDRKWICCGLRTYKSDDVNSLEIEERFTYDWDNKPWPTIKNIEYWVYPHNRNYGEWRFYSWEFLEFEFLKPNSESLKFHLSDFGLPEPKNVRLVRPTSRDETTNLSDLLPTQSVFPLPPINADGRSYFWYWLAAGGVGALGMGYSARRSFKIG